jgi:tellurite resistance protein TerC
MPIGIWVGFNVFVLAMLALDLLVFHRRAHEVRTREALTWTAIWIGVSLAFNVGVYHFMGAEAGLEFLTGYLIEKALSVDNIFVFILIFSYFRIPLRHQHRILFWGVLGALAMRGAMIGAGAYLVHRFHWILYILGAFLLVTGLRMAFGRDGAVELDSNPVIRLVRRFLPVTGGYEGQRFFVREPWGPFGALRLAATPLFVVLVLLETTDLLFAVDSIPAVFAITTDAFIVYTSNVLAILGLRSLYFVLAGVMHRFHYLRIGLSLVLGLVGVKMLVAGVYRVPVALSLGVVALVLVASVALSLLFPQPVEEATTARR